MTSPVHHTPDRQSRRDRLPDHPDRAAHGLRPSRSIRRPMPTRGMCDWRTRRMLIGPAAARESYLGDRKDHCGGERDAARRRSIPATASSRKMPLSLEACARAGLVFIGPPAAAIRAMGSKSAAKALMEKAGVPWCPAITARRRIETFARGGRADRLSGADQGVAGGGGKGMRVVRAPDELEPRLPAPSARRMPLRRRAAC